VARVRVFDRVSLPFAPVLGLLTWGAVGCAAVFLLEDFLLEDFWVAPFLAAGFLAAGFLAGAFFVEAGAFCEEVFVGVALRDAAFEADLFFEDLSSRVIQDDVFSRLLTFPNVIITAHQAFFTEEAVRNIAETTIGNVSGFERGDVPEANLVTSALVQPKQAGAAART